MTFFEENFLLTLETGAVEIRTPISVGYAKVSSRAVRPQSCPDAVDGGSILKERYHAQYHFYSSFNV